ncbi:hypothetical protein EK21DRAFT_64820, partial [Setomelanomma holmii]
HIDLGSEFHNHVQAYAKWTTALVSVSSRIVDTLRSTFNKVYKDGESPEDVCIAIISVPDGHRAVYRSARTLAEKCMLENPTLFHYEYIFEWEIPTQYLVHKVSVQTLLHRGLDLHKYLEGNKLPGSSDLSQELAKSPLDPSIGGWEVGISLGCMARCSGARAPVGKIAWHLHHDCSRVRHFDGDAQFAIISYWDEETSHLEFEHFFGIEDGIETALIDWWIADSRFLDDHEEHCAWALQISEDGEGDAGFDQVTREELITRIEDAAIKRGL